MIKLIKSRFKHLKEVWLFSDGQPTEMTLAIANIFLTPLAVCIELGECGLFTLFLIISGLHQLWCIAKDDLNCRLRGAFFTFSMYFATLLMYLGMIGLPTPSHYGWILLVVASFSSLLRIKKEQLYRL